MVKIMKTINFTESWKRSYLSSSQCNQCRVEENYWINEKILDTIIMCSTETCRNGRAIYVFKYVYIP